jgi:hypothetical protein
VKARTSIIAESVSILLPITPTLLLQVKLVMLFILICTPLIIGPLLHSTTDVTKLNPFFVYLLWLSGGVPRYIDHLVISLAKKSLSGNPHFFVKSDIPCIAQFIHELSHEKMIDVLTEWKHHCTRLFSRQKLSDPSSPLFHCLTLCC